MDRSVNTHTLYSFAYIVYISTDMLLHIHLSLCMVLLCVCKANISTTYIALIGRAPFCYELFY